MRVRNIDCHVGKKVNGNACSDSEGRDIFHEKYRGDGDGDDDDSRVSPIMEAKKCAAVAAAFSHI